jgi:RNA polymerase sigma-70 factor, ECF subfamily
VQKPAIPSLGFATILPRGVLEGGYHTMNRSASQGAALDITTCLVRWREGDRNALNELTDLVYRELRRLAVVFLRGEAPGHTLQPTALVHELYLRIEGVREVDWKCRAQFFGISARMMRNILVDHARKRRAAKRGSGRIVSLSDCDFQSGDDPDVLLVDMALSRFADKYPRQAQVVELRFFGGLTSEDTAEAMKIQFENTSLRTVERDWRFARAWLLNEIRSA